MKAPHMPHATCAMQDPSQCSATPECWQPVLQQRFLLMASEQQVLDLISANTSTLDAAVIFDGPSVSRQEGAAAQQGGQQQQEQLPPLLQYRIRLNHTDVPPPQLLYDMFDVSPGNTPVPGNDLWWVPAAGHAAASVCVCCCINLCLLLQAM